jgi:hypothetical protein
MLFNGELSILTTEQVLYYVLDRKTLNGTEPWLLVRFQNQWVNTIDLR